MALALATQAPHYTPAIRTRQEECLICASPDVVDGERLPCGHVHCTSCLRANLRVTMRTAPFRPVRCCVRIDTAVLRRAVRSLELAGYRQLVSEFDAPDKLYCWDGKCSTFIPAALRHGRAGTCRRCHTKTCADCKEKFHFGSCKTPSIGGLAARRKRDQELAFRRLSLEMHWKACPQCKRMVEKTEGCNHIQCVCGCHFCYRCGKAPYGNHGPCAM